MRLVHSVFALSSLAVIAGGCSNHTFPPETPEDRAAAAASASAAAQANPPPPAWTVATKLVASVASASSAPSVVTPPPAPQHPTPANALLILAKKDETLSIVDPSSLAILARVPVGHDPHEVVASTDGHTAYVSNYGGGSYHSIAVVDLTSQTAKPAIDLGVVRGPHGLQFLDGKVWFTAEGSKVVGSLDPAKSTIDFVLGTGQNRTHMLIVSADEKRILTTNVASGTFGILLKGEGHMGPPPAGVPGPKGPPPGPPPGPRPNDWDQTLIPVGEGTEGFDILPNGQEVWAADAQDGTIAIVDPSTKKLVHRIPAKVVGANRLKFTPDGRYALVSSLRGGDLTVYDVKTRTEAKKIPIGHGAAGILVQPDGARAFVSCSPDNYVAVIDLKTLTMAGQIEAGVEPDGLAWAVQH